MSTPISSNLLHDGAFAPKVQVKAPCVSPLPNLDTTDYIICLGENDVLCGRGSSTNDHTGNINFRKIIAKRKQEYLTTNNRQAKARIAREIFNQVGSCSPPGKFLKKVEEKELGGSNALVYRIVDEQIALEKVKQALRQNRGEKTEGLHRSHAIGETMHFNSEKARKKQESSDATALNGLELNDGEMFNILEAVAVSVGKRNHQNIQSGASDKNDKKKIRTSLTGEAQPSFSPVFHATSEKPQPNNIYCHERLPRSGSCFSTNRRPSIISLVDLLLDGGAHIEEEKNESRSCHDQVIVDLPGGSDACDPYTLLEASMSSLSICAEEQAKLEQHQNSHIFTTSIVSLEEVCSDPLTVS